LSFFSLSSIRITDKLTINWQNFAGVQLQLSLLLEYDPKANILMIGLVNLIHIIHNFSKLKFNYGCFQFSQPLTDEHLSFYFYEVLQSINWILLCCMNNAIEMV